MPPLRIAFFGSSLVSTFWNGAATCHRGLIRALAARGHRITFYEPDAYDRQRRRDMDDPSWAGVVVYRGDSQAAALEAVEQARGVDLVVKASGVGIHDELLETAVLDLQRPGTLVAFWGVDAPATLERVHHHFSDPFRQLIPRYDLVLTYGGGPPVVSAYAALGAAHCVPIYNALDPHSHFPVAPEPRFASDLAFLGHRLPDREARVDDFFLRAAECLPRRRFLLGGRDWADRPLPPNVRYAGPVHPRDHNAFNATPRAVLNINRASMARDGFSPPTRLFEAAGAGACLISDRWNGLDLFLEPDREVLVARDGTEVARHLAELTPSRATAIGAAARRRVLAAHTFAHRARQLENVLENAGAQRSRHDQIASVS